MFFAMNRFKVILGHENDFETVWRNRESKLHLMSGFVEFHLLRGASNKSEGYTLYVSHSTWQSQSDFTAWTKSENFRGSHQNAGQNKVLYKGPPVFESFEAVNLDKALL